MKPIERISRDLSYRGTVLDVYTDTVRVKDGTLAKWDFIGHVGAAAVIPVLPDGRILMVKQWRNALDRFTLELPAGKLDSPEEPMIQCAARELEEEAGVRSDNLKLLVTVNTTVAFCNEKIGIFVATDLKESAQHLDYDEEIEVSAWSLPDLLDMIYEQKLTDGKTVAGLLAYAARKDSL